MQVRTTQNLTMDGREISIVVTLSKVEEAKEALLAGASGVGLLRTDFLFWKSLKEPSFEIQLALYQGVVDIMGADTVVIRTFDVGLDNNVPYINIDHEENPMLGLRGMRNYHNNMAILQRQLQAILSVHPLESYRIMIPMVADVDDFLRAKNWILEAKTKSGITETLSIGTMIEVPAAAFLIDQLAKHADFFSIGTNDLAQYVLAMDRGNTHIADKVSNFHPGVLRVVRHIILQSNQANIPVNICGSMSCELLLIPILIGLGVKEISVTYDFISSLRSLISKLSYEECVYEAEKVLNMQYYTKVESYLRDRYKNLL